MPDLAEPFIQITRDVLDRDAILAAVQDPAAGAIVTFEGAVRNHARGRAVEFLEYEAYVEMAESQMRGIAQEAQARWELCRVAVAHRFGRMAVGETSVIIAVASAHRGEAFEACRFIIDTLKTTVPIWKKEIGSDGAEWVEG
jgi:molybdopterin synthase catalytic subunit